MNPTENTLSSAKLALASRTLRAQIDSGLVTSEPIAIVGIGCRFPGGIDSAEDYWRFVTKAGDAVREAPPERWDARAYYDPDVATPGKMNGRWGGFLDGADLFDPGYFGISPREAAAMDPQQRLALEVAWQAVHDSGYAPGQLAGSRIGVFMAVYNTDYNRLLFANADAIGPHTCAGGSHSMASGRISFLLDLHGPSFSVDSACSSSLVAIHVAVQSLRIGDCDAAMAGGVSLKLLPEHYISLSKLSMLSPDGKCRTFDAAANGFVPGEGCGVVVLKRLSDALAAGDRIHAVIRGCAAGQDGRTASLTAPNGVAQQQVIRAALANARVNPGEIGYVETHGTGTALGDPIEVEALAAVLGSGSRPCALGAVKSNFGHLEAAAGVAGLIKAALALEHAEIPPNLNYQSLNPHISLEGTRFQIPLETAPWAQDGGPRLAGVSSFGFTGTNAHLVLEEPPHVPLREDAQQPGPYILTISARTAEARDDYAGRYAAFLESEGQRYSVAEICRNAALRRDHYEERMAVLGTTHDELRVRLEEARMGSPSPETAVGRAALNPEPIAWVFSGQGSQWPRMGVGLIQAEPVFASVIDRCDALIRREAGWSLRQVLEADEAASLLQRTQYAQAAIFAIQVALAELWKSWGLRPAAVLGHSVGEVAAAHVSGVLSLEDAVRVAVHRGRLMDAATGRGRMLSVALPARIVEAELPVSVSVAAINAPASTVVSGDTAAIEQLASAWRARGVSAQLLPVDYAFHSEQMEPARQELPRLLGSLATHVPDIRILSTVTGMMAVAGDYGAEYWGLNVRRPVRFQQAVEQAVALGCTRFLEVGPHAVLSQALAACTPPETVVIRSLRRNRDERTCLAAAAGRFYTLGYNLNWAGICGASRTVVPLPAYPYQRRRYWLPEPPKRTVAPAANPGGCGLPGELLQSPALRGKVWQATVGADHPLIRGHKIAGAVVFPLAGFLQAATAALRQASGVTAVSVTDLEIGEALQISEPVHVQTVMEQDRLETYSLSQGQWKRHVSARMQAVADALSPLVETPAPEVVDVSGYYSAMAEAGLEYGSEYRTIRELRAGNGSAQSLIELDAETASAADPISPALLDGCLQTALAASGNVGTLFMPLAIDRFTLYGEAPARVRCFMRTTTEPGSGALLADFDLVDEAGVAVASGRGLKLKRVRNPQIAYEFQWRKAERQFSPAAERKQWLLVAEDGAHSENVMSALRAHNAHCVRLSPTDVSGMEPRGCRGVLCLASAASGEDAYGVALRALQRIASANAQSECELWLASCNAQRAVAEDACEGHAQAVLWGLGRTAALEYPDLRCVRVDLDGSEAAAKSLAGEMLSPAMEDELAFRAGTRYTTTLERVPTALLTPPPQRLTVRERGSLDALTYEPATRRAPAEDEVEVEVHASALNFRDVLNALGRYPGEAGHLGLEFCGRVLSTGGGVRHCKAGDLVMGIGWGAFSDVFIAKGALVAPVPEGLNSEAAVTLPNAFCTAYHCLITQGGLKRNQRVLIHAAAGGVGLMAVQIARHAGAEVFATAGSAEKREFLRTLGVPHVFDSRTLDFTTQVLDAAGGQGVDLALNSLSGEFIPATFSAVARGGRFVEIGKTGIWDAASVAALGKQIRYSVVDLGVTIDNEPEVIGAYFRELHALVRSGAIQPLPAKVFPFEKASEAFRFMAQARHTGKIVLRHTAAAREISGTWLLTGGFGALGLETARWLAERGASTLVMAGRHLPVGESLKAVEELTNCGVRIETHVADVSRREDVEALLAAVRSRHGRLDGVVHLAGALGDGVLAQQNQEKFELVFDPKARAAWHLHEAVQLYQPQRFILFSSAASALGSPAQANYAAANAALDALANYRAAQHLPAISVAWGPWADVGMAAAVQASGVRRTMPMLRPLKAADCFAALEWALASGKSNVALLAANWRQWNELPSRSRTRVGATSAPTRNEATAAPVSIFEEIARLAPSRRRNAMLDYLRRQTGIILGLGESSVIEESDPLARMGLDSLMALELRNVLARSFGRQFPATLLFDHPTLGALTDHLMGNGEVNATDAAVGDALLDEISALSEEDAEQLLANELSAGSGS